MAVTQQHRKTRVAGGASAPAATRQRGNPVDRQRKRLLIPFVGPAFLFYTLVFIVPTLAAVWISFNKWPGAGPMKFVGLNNYVHLFSDQLFLHAFGNTLLMLFVVGIAIFLLAFISSLVLRDMLGKKFARSVIFFPHLVNALIFGALAGFIFNPAGLVNTTLGWLGIKDQPQWLSPSNMFPLIMATMIWVTTGYYTTILMAGVDRIPAYFYEDCALAGASPFQRLRYVILPLTWDVFATCAVLWTISSVKIFEIIWIFGGTSGIGIPPTQTWTTAVYTYVTAFSGESIPSFGAATASAILSLLLVTIIVVLVRRVMRRDAVQF